MLDGKWKSEDTWGGLDAGMVVMSPYTNMPDDVKKMARRPRRRSRPARCIRSSVRSSIRTARQLECKGGTRLDDGQILSMNFYVKGIDDKVPGK